MIRTLILAPLALSARSEAPLCSSEVIKVARDPGSDRYAVTESRNCGATTDYATVVRVGRASERQADAEDVFVADSDHGAATSGQGGTVWTHVVWTGSGQLSITMRREPGCSNIYQRQRAPVSASARQSR